MPAPRKLLLFCDGTNNTLTGRIEDTNVLKLYERFALGQPAGDNGPLLLYYDPGVGSAAGAPPIDFADMLQKGYDRAIELALGRGIYRNIEEGYRFLMQNWRPGDEIYCFGFSRGAFTARAVVGMVNLFGIIQSQHRVLLPTLLRVYFTPPDAPASGKKRSVAHGLSRYLARRSARHKQAEAAAGHVAGGASGRERDGPHGGKPGGQAGAEAQVTTRENLAEQIRADFNTPASRDAWVHFVGVWDTVESVGLIPVLTQQNPSPATLVGKRIHHVRHALSFDEHRYTFQPRLYDEPGDIDTPAQTLRQRWFPGVHSDAGGGYLLAQAGLSDNTLGWMITELAPCGLIVPPPLPTPADQLPPAVAPARLLRHDALYSAPFWALIGMCVRNLQPRTAQGVPITITPGPLPPDATLSSEWDRRRPVSALLAAVLIGFLCLWLSGMALQPDGPQGGIDALLAPSRWAWQLLYLDHVPAVRALLGLPAPGTSLLQRLLYLHQNATPGWSIFWDFGFIACWGYLLARVASRAFTFLAGPAGPQSTGYRGWLLLGLLPACAALGDVAENFFTLAALAAHGTGTDIGAACLLGLATLAAWIKMLGLLGSVLAFGPHYLWLQLTGKKLPARPAGKVSAPPAAPLGQGR
ncbi:DUF2235 domain-containing protein [Andreprevotia sp. IGB-42]|uniref:T6SS phospholipase effector Tle1-like catalytic domain-containing protein n=1 Tax=Andreprevotia sp. IGB-42 TaxID=2497473 RepID=UPI00135ADE6D|nr:DUF2235 domain-containing protein [Andreprevotia sp. IGB-42]